VYSDIAVCRRRSMFSFDCESGGSFFAALAWILVTILLLPQVLAFETISHRRHRNLYGRRINHSRAISMIPVFHHSKSFCDTSFIDNKQKRSTTLQFMSTQSSSSSSSPSSSPSSSQAAQLPPALSSSLSPHSSSSDHRDKSIVASQRLGVRPSRINFPPWFWKLSWKVHSVALPILHRWDKAPTPDLANCLKCVWCKALSANDKSSPVYEGPQGWTYDMLPSITRWFIIKNPFLPLWFFPRLVHYVIELRTTFLNRSLRNEIRRYQEQEQVQSGNKEITTTAATTTTTTTTNDKKMTRTQKIRLISLGAGYDTRSIQFLNVNEDYAHNSRDSVIVSVGVNDRIDRDAIRIDEAYEMDLPEVVSSKTIMLDRLVERRRTQHLHERKEVRLPILMSQNLKDVEGLKDSLDKIFMRDGTTETNSDDNSNDYYYTIFLVEGVLIYLSEQQRSDVLSTCSQYLKDRDVQGSLLFADRIRKPSDPSVNDMKGWLDGDGWTLDEASFTVHPGKARHMGIARV